MTLKLVVLINIILLGADQPISVSVALAKDVSNDLLIEGLVPRLPTFFVLQLQVFFNLKAEKKKYETVND